MKNKVVADANDVLRGLCVHCCAYRVTFKNEQYICASLWISVWTSYQFNLAIVWCNYSFLHFNINNLSVEIEYNMGLWTMLYKL